MKTKRCTKCGEEKAVAEFYLRGDGGYRENRRSRCKACYPRETAAHAAARRARRDNEPERFILRNMVQRCHNPRNPAFANYGGRGVAVCSDWRSDADKFLRDVGPRPGRDYSIERIDNDRGYEPGNCRWATRSEQNRNTRQNHRITFRGRTRCLADWAALVGLTRSALKDRLRRGWSAERALTTPLLRQGRKATV